jgi:hypothetical protein
MIRLALIALLLPACTASTLAGATTMTALAVGSSALSRSAGGCYAICTNGTVCNPHNGLCERMPCRGQCSADEHCEVTATSDYCAPGAPSDVLSKSPGSTKTLPIMPPPAPVQSGAGSNVTPAAEANPPGGK